MIVGCYNLHLYCDGDPPTCDRVIKFLGGAEFGSMCRNEREARKEARESGWSFEGKTCFCPGCTKLRKKSRKE